MPFHRLSSVRVTGTMRECLGRGSARQGIRRGQVDRSPFTYDTHVHRCDRARTESTIDRAGTMDRPPVSRFPTFPLSPDPSASYPRERDMNFCLDNCALLYVADPLDEPFYVSPRFGRPRCVGVVGIQRKEENFTGPPLPTADREMEPRSGGTY